MTKTGLETHATKVTGALNQPLEHSAILTVYFMVNSMNDRTTYNVQVFKIKRTILCIVMSTK